LKNQREAEGTTLGWENLLQCLCREKIPGAKVEQLRGERGTMKGGECYVWGEEVTYKRVSRKNRPKAE